MARINLPDGRNIKIGKYDIKVYFGDIPIGELRPCELIDSLRYLDSLEKEPIVYDFKGGKG